MTTTDRHIWAAPFTLPGRALAGATSLVATATTWLTPTHTWLTDLPTPALLTALAVTAYITLHGTPGLRIPAAFTVTTLTLSLPLHPLALTLTLTAHLATTAALLLWGVGNIANAINTTRRTQALRPATR